MKILNLRFKNINSLKGEYEINFCQPPLSTAGLFAIIGSTGSGKSTILDAISLALFNKTPRSGSLSKNYIENYGSVMTQNTNECYTEVEYEVNNKIYRSKWEISRARTGSLRDYKMEISELPENKILDLDRRGVPEKNTEIIGLNYDQFVKSILLSQGEFAKFLKADTNERGELLEKITGTEIYRQIGKAAFDKLREIKVQYENFKFQIENLKFLSAEEINELNNQLISINSNTTDNQKNLENYAELEKIKQQIVKCQSEKNALEKSLQLIYIEINNNKSDSIRLQKHEKLIVLKSDIFELQNLKKNQKLIKEKINQNNIKINELTNKLKFNQEISTSVSIKKTEKISEFEDIKPVCSEIRELDNKLVIQKKILDEEQNVLFQKQKAYTVHENETSSFNKQLELLKNKKQELENKLKTNEFLNDLSSELSLINEKAAAINEAVKQIQIIPDEIKKLEIYNQLKTIINRRETVDILKQYISNSQKQINSLNSKTEYQIEQLSFLNSERLKLVDFYNGIKKQVEISVENTKKQNVLTDNTLKISDTKKLSDELHTSLQNQLHESEIVSKYIDELKIRLERQQLEAKYDEDRKKLKETEPCFLCGSKEHPYVKSYSNQVSDTQQLLQQKEKSYKKILSDIQNTEIHIAKQKTEIDNFEKENQRILLELKKLHADFSEINQQIKTTNFITETDKINQLLDEAKNKGIKIKEQIVILEQISAIKNEKNILDLYLDKNEKIISVENSFKQTIEKYKPLIENETIPEKITERLKNALTELLKEKDLFTETVNLISTNEKLLEERKINLTKQKDELLIQENKIKHFLSELDEIKKIRVSKFGNKIPDKVETELRNVIEELSTEFSKTEIELTKLNAELLNSEENKQELEYEYEQLQLSIENKQSILLPKLNIEGYQSIESALEAILPTDSAEKIRNKQVEIEKQKFSTENSISEKETEIKTLLQSDDSSIDLKQLQNHIELIKTKINESNQIIGSIKHRLSENEQNKSNEIQLRKQYEIAEKEFYRWDNLNRLIGDAEGKKFSKFAQELTLLQLIGLANRHLKSFNKRYILKKGSGNTKEDLIVVDTFLANTERSVQTLSGGETFLLSLALALGLSDLAGQNTKIESLFIDEGFGSLDQETLDTAIQALEELQSITNRTIGIISHVQQLKERITTKIELIKVNSGFSTIVIG